MGLDIHTVVQIANKKEWQTISSDLTQDCCYITFKVLANIGNLPYPYIHRPKGLPDDLQYEDFYTSSLNSNDKLWLGNHSFSYYTLHELLETNTSFKNTYLYLWIEQLLELKKEYKVPLSSIRVVFGFDSW